jgi:MgtC family
VLKVKCLQKAAIESGGFEGSDSTTGIWAAAIIFARLAAALLAGAAIGAERQWHQKMAGLRANALLAA